MTAQPPEVVEVPPYTPRFPALSALGLFTLWPALLALPMLSGRWLASVWSDQYTAGFPFQAWSAEWWKRTGHMPLWNPELFGGLPFVASGSGDVFYPTWLLRLLVSTPTAENISFFVHYVLAGLFMYWLLRRLGLAWGGAVVGGLAYELTGLIASYPSPGHDGKLFASTMLPLICFGLVLTVRDKRWCGYPLIAIGVALSVFGHFQLTYYLLIAAALFALYLATDPAADASVGARAGRLGLALLAVLLGFGIAAVQLLPFFAYIPYSPRAQGYNGGFAGSTSFAIPWDHVLEFFLKDFVGSRDTYWGSNPLKLHSEYLGLPVIALATLGLGVGARRRMLLWLGGIGLLFLLVSLGAGTPFYGLWWTLMPLVKKTRAPGMSFFIVAFVTAVFAALGAERALAGAGRRAFRPLLIVAAVIGGLALVGVFGQVARTIAQGLSADAGRDTVGAANANQGAILWGALTSAVALALAALCVGLRRVPPAMATLGLAFVVGGDLWVNARPFWDYTEPYGRDAVIDRLAATRPSRVLNFNAYPGSALMAFDIADVLGYHGNELANYDALLGGKNEWRNLGALKLWDLLAVSHVVVPAGMKGADSIPGFRRVLDTTISTGGRVRLFDRLDSASYVRVVPAAVKADTGQIIPTLLDPRLDFSRIVLFAQDAPIVLPPLSALPPPSASRALVKAWRPGAMSITLDPPPTAPSYLLISENWFPDWLAWADGKSAQVLRGDYALLTVAVPAGTHQVELAFRSRAYENGRTLTRWSLLLLAALGVGSLFQRTRDG
ncbi:MAG TPA: YfhO family protein [Gemmatimonadales bacterium]|nr:YfhO family protein [Gemmatimonadales bacterium]